MSNINTLVNEAREVAVSKNQSKIKPITPEIEQLILTYLDGDLKLKQCHMVCKRNKLGCFNGYRIKYLQKLYDEGRINGTSTSTKFKRK